MSALASKAMAYFELTKPRALVMIVFTTAITYLIAAANTPEGLVLLHIAVGVSLAAGGSLALNQHMEHNLDARMERTRHRPIPSGRLSSREGFYFALVTMFAGFAYLYYFINPACCLATIICGIFYNLFYTPLKQRSSFSSFVGAIPGGMLPVMGWAAARGEVETGALILFVILFLWQIPHALIISIRHKTDYEEVGMKQLPIVSGDQTSRRQMILNVLILIPVSILPFHLNMTEIRYPLIAALLGLFLLAQVIHYSLNVSERGARRVFISLSAYLPLLMLAMYIDKPG